MTTFEYFDKNYVKGWYENESKKVASFYGQIPADIVEYGPLGPKNFIVSDSFTPEARNARQGLVKDIINKIDSLDAHAQKVSFCHILLEPDEDYESTRGMLYFAPYYIVSELFLHFKDRDVPLSNEIAKILKEILLFAELPDKDKIEELLEKGVGSRFPDGWTNEYEFKRPLWDTIQYVDDIETQTLALMAIIDDPHDVSYYVGGSYGSIFTYYYMPRYYFVAELIENDIPNRAEILIKATEHICLREKLNRREEDLELWFIVRETLRVNSDYPSRVDRIFGYVNEIGRIGLSVRILERICTDKKLSDLLWPQIKEFSQNIARLIDSKPSKSAIIGFLSVINYTKDDVYTLRKLMNIIDDNDMKNILSNCAQSLEDLWNEHAGDSPTEMLKSEMELSIRARVPPTISSAGVVNIVHQDESLTRKYKEKVLRSAAKRGDIEAIRTLAEMKLNT